MNRDDFKVIADSRGYMIHYKGKPIGGAGISKDAKGPTGRQATAQAMDYLKYGDSDIQAILAGTGQQRFYDEIKRIDADA
jgi:hypothetical protein